MKLKTLGLMASIALGALSMAVPAMAQTVIKVWSIDGANAPGIGDTLSKAQPGCIILETSLRWVGHEGAATALF